MAESEPFIGWLNIKLASKTIKAEHNVAKDNKGRDQMRFTKFFRHGASAGGASTGTSSAPAFD